MVLLCIRTAGVFVFFVFIYLFLAVLSWVMVSTVFLVASYIGASD